MRQATHGEGGKSWASQGPADLGRSQSFILRWWEAARESAQGSDQMCISGYETPYRVVSGKASVNREGPAKGCCTSQKDGSDRISVFTLKYILLDNSWGWMRCGGKEEGKKRLRCSLHGYLGAWGGSFHCNSQGGRGASQVMPSLRWVWIIWREMLIASWICKFRAQGRGWRERLKCGRH